MSADRPTSLADARRARCGVSLNVEARSGRVSLALASSEAEAQAWLSPDEADAVALDLQQAARVAREAQLQDPVRVPLGHGLFGLVDGAEGPRVLALTWHAWHKPGRPDVIYAQHTYRYGGGGRQAKTGAILLHRFVLGAKPGTLVDHRDGNGLDCRRHNLRSANKRQNSQHVVLSPNQRRGGFKGVSRSTNGSWVASIRGGEVGADGRRQRLHLGSFAKAEAAARAYDAAALRCFGEFASLNFRSGQVTAKAG